MSAACEVCGKSLAGTQGVRFCSLQCSGIRRRKRAAKTCTGCGRSFVGLPGQRACSHVCSQVHRRKYRTEPVVCVGCGATYIRSSLHPHQQYCSRACFESSPRPGRRTGRDVTCAHCGKSFYLSRARLDHASNYFCSQEHANEYQRRTKVRMACAKCGRVCLRSPSLAGNRAYCSIKCRDADPVWRAEIIERGAAQSRRSGPNGLESAGYALLDRTGVAFERQAIIANKFCVDARCAPLRLVVQFDGDYWHGNPRRYSALDDRQRRRRALDKSQDAYMRKLGLRVVRFWEHEIHESPDACLARLDGIIAELRAAGERQPSLFDVVST